MSDTSDQTQAPMLVEAAAEKNGPANLMRSQLQLPLLALALVGVSFAGAHGWANRTQFQAMFDSSSSKSCASTPAGQCHLAAGPGCSADSHCCVPAFQLANLPSGGGDESVSALTPENLDASSGESL